MAKVARIALFVLLSAAYLSPTNGVKHECILDKDSTLTTFNQETVTVTPPCKFHMANMTCGDYWVRVNPGLGVWQSESKFTPVTVRVTIRNQATGEQADYRISMKRLKKGWKNVDSTSVGLDFDGYDTAIDRASLRKDSVFEVEAGTVGNVIVRCHTDQFSSTGMPDSFCGDGSGTKEIENEAALHSELTKEDIASMIIMLNNDIRQSKTCTDLHQYALMCAGSPIGFSMCDIIITDPKLAECLAKSEKPLAQHFTDCMGVVCSGRGDPTPIVEANTFIAENCEGVDMIGPEEVWPKS